MIIHENFLHQISPLIPYGLFVSSLVFLAISRCATFSQCHACTAAQIFQVLTEWASLKQFS